MTSILEVKQGILYQGSDESLQYTITTTPWGSDPTGTAVVAYDETAGYTTVTNTIFPTNEPSEDGDKISLSLLKNMTVGHIYRVEVKFTDGDDNIWECFFKVKCER